MRRFPDDSWCVPDCLALASVDRHNIGIVGNECPREGMILQLDGSHLERPWLVGPGTGADLAAGN